MCNLSKSVLRRSTSPCKLRDKLLIASSDKSCVSELPRPNADICDDEKAALTTGVTKQRIARHRRLQKFIYVVMQRSCSKKSETLPLVPERGTACLMEMKCSPRNLLLDLDHTLFHTLHNNKTYARPGLLEFLQKVSVHYRLFVFTMGTRQYAHEKCTQLGITKYIPLERIYAREDTVRSPETGHHIKRFRIVLCETCLRHCIAVDDHPAYWNVPVFECTQKNLNTNKILKPRSVIHIPPFTYVPGQHDQWLFLLGDYLVRHAKDI